MRSSVTTVESTNLNELFRTVVFSHLQSVYKRLHFIHFVQPSGEEVAIQSKRCSRHTVTCKANISSIKDINFGGKISAQHSPISLYQLQSTPDNSNLQGNSSELSGVRVIEGKIIENDLKGNENWFELAGGSS